MLNSTDTDRAVVPGGTSSLSATILSHIKQNGEHYTHGDFVITKTNEIGIVQRTVSRAKDRVYQVLFSAVDRKGVLNSRIIRQSDLLDLEYLDKVFESEMLTIQRQLISI